eukprot:gene29130-36219_t
MATSPGAEGSSPTEAYLPQGRRRRGRGFRSERAQWEWH